MMLYRRYVNDYCQLWCAIAGNLELINLNLNGKSIGLYYTACYGGHVELLKMLPEINPISSMSIKDMVCFAILRDHVQVLEYLDAQPLNYFVRFAIKR